MRDLLTDPMCRAEDLGKPLPPMPYGVSVCLPLWEHVVGYEEKAPAILSHFQSGYPRFFCPPSVTALFSAAEKEFAKDGERAIVFPRMVHADRCAAFVKAQSGRDAKLQEFGPDQWGAVILPDTATYDVARRYWRHCGEVVSARQCDAFLGKATETYSKEEGYAAVQKIKARLAEHSGQKEEDVFLFPSGMAAIYAVYRMVSHLFPGRKSVQLDFPYTDVLKVQQLFGSGVHFLPFVDDADYERLRQILRQEPVSGFFAELPSNPLLKCVDLRRVSEMLFAEERDAPIIVDDTVATSVNMDAFLLADVVTTSLTKTFSGVGDVLAGSVILNSDSPYREEFSQFLRQYHDNELWYGDAIVLEKNSRQFAERARTMSRNSIAMYEFLSEHPAVERVHHSLEDRSGIYEHLLKPDGGHGCLVSVVLKDRAKSAPVYDAMEFSKGPSLGTDFTLVCPYTLLAHYDELDWADSCGVDKHLLRISCGIEPAEVIIERMKKALEA